MSNSTNIYKKLQTLQTQMGTITKTGYNKFQKTTYLTETDILTVLRPLLNQEKLILLFSDDPASPLSKEKVEKEWQVHYLKKIQLINADNPTEQLTYHFWAAAQNTDLAKAKGSAETYAIKYFLSKFLLIPVTEQVDPDSRPESK